MQAAKSLRCRSACRANPPAAGDDESRDSSQRACSRAWNIAQEFCRTDPHRSASLHPRPEIRCDPGSIVSGQTLPHGCQPGGMDIAGQQFAPQDYSAATPQSYLPAPHSDPGCVYLGPTSSATSCEPSSCNCSVALIFQRNISAAGRISLATVQPFQKCPAASDRTDPCAPWPRNARAAAPFPVTGKVSLRASCIMQSQRQSPFSV